MSTQKRKLLWVGLICLLVVVIAAGLLIRKHIETTKQNKTDALNEFVSELSIYPPTVYPSDPNLQWERELRVNADQKAELSDVWHVKNTGDEAIFVTVVFPGQSAMEYEMEDGKTLTQFLQPRNHGNLTAEGLQSGSLFRQAAPDWDGTTVLQSDTDVSDGMRFVFTQFTLEPEGERTLRGRAALLNTVADIRFLPNWQEPKPSLTRVRIHTGEKIELVKQTVTETAPDGNPWEFVLNAEALSGMLSFRISN